MRTYTLYQNVDFRCKHCRYHVSANPILSGVSNRNHCPYCLWSRHLDLFTAGDRLSACKAPMRPVGLTLKRSRKKYGHLSSGELMLVHECIDCGKVAINRIAADDDVDLLLDTFECSLGLDRRRRSSLAESQILILGAGDEELVRSRLFGERCENFEKGRLQIEHSLG
jgi:hypothetical protein